MKQIVPLLVTVLLVVSAVAVFPAGASAPAAQDGTVDGGVGVAQTDDATDGQNETNESVQPGARFAGVIGVQEAEIDGEIDARTFGVRFGNATDNGAKAAVVADRVNASREQLRELEREQTRLREAYQNGSMSQGEFRAKMATNAARVRVTERLVNQSSDAAQGLPVERLEAKGVNATAILTLRERARHMTGPEVATIARSIAGPNVGEPPGLAHSRGPGPGPATDAFPDEMNASLAVQQAEQRVERARERVERAEERLAGASPNENATRELERARDRLRAAEDALDDAQAALDAGDEDAAREHANAAVRVADAAMQHARGAIDAGMGSPGPSDGPGPSGDSGNGSNGGGSGGGGSNR